MYHINAFSVNSNNTVLEDTSTSGSSFLTGRTQSVIVEGVTSDSALVVNGVPQGSVLGPFLFLLFINDLPDNLTSHTRRFADIVYRTIKSQDDCAALQQDLHTLAHWELKLRMEFHPQNCSVLIVTSSRSPIREQYQLKGYELQDTAKYIGVDTQSSLSWKKTQYRSDLQESE